MQQVVKVKLETKVLSVIKVLRVLLVNKAQ